MYIYDTIFFLFLQALFLYVGSEHFTLLLRMEPYVIRTFYGIIEKPPIERRFFFWRAYLQRFGSTSSLPY